MGLTMSLFDEISFEVFWDAYDKKVNRPKSEEKWNKLSEENRIKILRHIPLYIEAQPNKKYRKNPTTYINNKAWEDEIIRDNNGITKEQSDKLIEVQKTYFEDENGERKHNGEPVQRQPFGF
ncbi:MAG: hypothetical protein GY936_14320 [Ignavibacteriae bacterium]|nr:hypothetical protein [Ignavibacteriota bacterium]